MWVHTRSPSRWQDFRQLVACVCPRCDYFLLVVHVVHDGLTRAGRGWSSFRRKACWPPILFLVACMIVVEMGGDGACMSGRNRPKPALLLSHPFPSSPPSTCKSPRQTEKKRLYKTRLLTASLQLACSCGLPRPPQPPWRRHCCLRRHGRRCHHLLSVCLRRPAIQYHRSVRPFAAVAKKASSSFPAPPSSNKPPVINIKKTTHQGLMTEGVKIVH